MKNSIAEGKAKRQYLLTCKVLWFDVLCLCHVVLCCDLMCCVVSCCVLWIDVMCCVVLCCSVLWFDVLCSDVLCIALSRQIACIFYEISISKYFFCFFRCCFKFFEEDSSLRSLFVRLALPIYQARQQARERKDTGGNEDAKVSSPITVHLRTESVSVLKQNMPENHQYVRFRDSICQNPLWSISVQDKRDSLNSASCEPQTTEEKAKDSVLVCQSGLNSPLEIESDVGCGSAHHDGVHDAVPSRETKKTSCSSWTLLEGGDAGAGTSVDECMMRKHSLGVMEALGATVECLDDSLFLCDILTALGQIHASYNVKGHYLPVSETPNYLDINQQYFKIVDPYFVKSAIFSPTWSCGSR